MALDMRINGNKLEGCPPGQIVLFLAKLLYTPEITTYCAIFGPKELAHPTASGHTVPLVDTTLAVFDEKGNLASFYPVLDGYKLITGGGKAYMTEQRHSIQWTTPGECGRYEFYGNCIEPQNVYVAL